MNTSPLMAVLRQAQTLWISQRFELAELVGLETRNKYAIRDANGRDIAFAGEQGKGLAALLVRGFLGHWRTFEIHLFDEQRQLFARAVHPFRWYFQRFEVFGADGRPLGALQQRFAWFAKSFDVEDQNGQVQLTVRSPWWKPWTFPFLRGGQPVAEIRKRWTGFGAEMFTDKDTFQLEYQDPSLGAEARTVLLLGAVFVDMQYFEKKANN